uniref:Uncharacterized protein n=1 Tax=Chlamydomonas leiostraca TaxID=1034604 RepID=A0A7S0X1C2_9CHLO
MPAAAACPAHLHAPVLLVAAARAAHLPAALPAYAGRYAPRAAPASDAPLLPPPPWEEPPTPSPSSRDERTWWCAAGLCASRAASECAVTVRWMLDSTALSQSCDVVLPDTMCPDSAAVAVLGCGCCGRTWCVPCCCLWLAGAEGFLRALRLPSALGEQRGA